jgi:hypothetical protein
VSSVSKSNACNFISNTIARSNVSSIVPLPLLLPTWVPSCHCLCLQVHFTPYPLLLVFLIFFYFALCCRKHDEQLVVHHHLPFRVDLVQKTMTSTCITCLHLLCVAKRVLICNMLIILKRWWGAILHHAYVELVEFFC